MKQLLIIGLVWPEPNSSAAGSRMMQIITAFLQDNYQITFATAASRTESAFPIETLGIVVKSIELNANSFDDFIKQLNPNVVLFDRFLTEEQFGWRVAEYCPNALRILDTEDLHGLRKGRQLALKANKPFDNTFLFNDTAKREIASIFRSDISLIISEAEMEILKNDFKIPDHLLVYLPFMLDNSSLEIINELPNYETRNHFIFIGNFLHEPNYDAVLYLKESIWPLIRKQLPKAELYVYGAYASQKVIQLNNEKEGFIIKGFAENVADIMKQAKICLAPLRFGAGLKGKLIDAMQYGTPCIMTSIAAEGMFGNLEPNGFIEDTPEHFAKSAVQLFHNDALWKAKQENGFDIINKRFQKSEFQKAFILKVRETLEALHDQRLNNFTGQMLQYHTLQSTKYMSKWIEEKNKQK